MKATNKEMFDDNNDIKTTQRKVELCMAGTMTLVGAVIVCVYHQVLGQALGKLYDARYEALLLFIGLPLLSFGLSYLIFYIIKLKVKFDLHIGVWRQVVTFLTIMYFIVSAGIYLLSAIGLDVPNSLISQITLFFTPTFPILLAFFLAVTSLQNKVGPS